MVRTFMAGAVAALALTMLPPGRAVAQSGGPLFPPSIAITNYNRVLVGEQEALESGAFVARAADSTAGWYNPAGMATVQRTAIGASGTGFEADLLTLEGVGSQRGGGMNVYQLPHYFGAVLGREVIDSDHWRLGFTITKPVSWAQDVNAGFPGDSRISYASHVSLGTLTPMVSAAWSPFPALRLGAGVGLAITTLTEVQTLSQQLVTPTTANAFLRTLDGGGSVWSLTGDLGLQWDVTENLVVGALVRFPGVRIIQSGRLTYQDVDNGASPWSQTFFSDPDASFDYRLPFSASVGVAWRSREFEVEADLRYYSAISSYALLSSNAEVITTTTGPTGSPVVTRTPFDPVMNGARTVWGVALGGRYNLDRSWSFHGGFLTDPSPTAGTSTYLFRSVNMYGITVGAKLRGEHLSGSLGLGCSWGSSDPFTFAASVPGATPLTTRLTVTSLYLLYAVAYRF
jgi:long-subunit fatty acid transport protein